MSKPEMPSREEMAEEWVNKYWPYSADDLRPYARKHVLALLAYRDEMVGQAYVDALIERSDAYESIKNRNPDGHIPEGQLFAEVERCIDILRALKGKLR